MTKRIKLSCFCASSLFFFVVMIALCGFLALRVQDFPTMGTRKRTVRVGMNTVALMRQNTTKEQKVKATAPRQTIYAVTCTYTRITQKADLTRLIQTLMHVSSLHWIVVEDSDKETPLVKKLLENSGLKYTHLYTKNSAAIFKHIQTLNMALAWIRANVGPNEGVVYFMDDDNSYDIKLFEEMRTTKVVSVWPVGLVGGLLVEGPVECKNGRVLTWRVSWRPDRTIPIDMAGFAINTALLHQHPDGNFIDVHDGESQFLGALGLTRDKAEGKGKDCTEVYVWHTQTQKFTPESEGEILKLGPKYNPNIEV
ncbi:galactosylgalactosylxylosylprotein 3-beta-glucuronosyltransferase sqv-8-like [Ciona intestinalis]